MKSRTWQRWGSGWRAGKARLDWRVAAAYGAVLTSLVAVLILPGSREPTAVPAFSQPGPAASGISPLSWFWVPSGGTRLMKSSLTAAMPALALASDETGEGPTSGLGRWLAEVLGVNPLDPRSLLAAGIPGLRDPGPAEHGEQAPGQPGTPQQPSSDITNPAPVVTGSEPIVAIYHTHAYESYASAVKLPKGAPLSYAITNDDKRNIVAVGARLAADLADRGVPVAHSEAHHGPQVGAYVRSRETAENILKAHPTVEVLLDVHRDSQPRTLTATTIDGKPAARIMIVVAKGSDDLKQPFYPKNLQFAQRLYQAVEARYPGLMRPIYEEPARYNQDLMPAALLFEVGGPENTLEEVYHSIDLLAPILAEQIKRGSFPRKAK